MRYSVFILLTFSLFTKTLGFSLKVKIDNLPNREIYLAYYRTGKTYMLDTAKTDLSGYALFNQNEKLPQGFYYLVLPNKTSFEFILGYQQDLTIKTNVTNILNSLIITPESETLDFFQFQKLESEQEKIKNQLLNNTLKSNKKNKDTLLYMYNTVKNLDKTLSTRRTELIQKYPNSFLSEYLKSITPTTLPDYKNLHPELHDSIIMRRKIQYSKDHYFDNFSLTSDYILRNPEFFRKFDVFFNKLLSDNTDTIAHQINIFLNACKPNNELYKISLLTFYTWYRTNSKINEHIIKNYFLSNTPEWIEQSIIDSLKNKYLVGNIKCEYLPSFNDFTETHQEKVFELNDKNIIMFYNNSCNVCKNELKEILNDQVNCLDYSIFLISVEQDKSLNNIENKNIHYLNIKTDYSFPCATLSTLPQYILFDRTMKILKTEQNVEKLIN